MTTHKMILRFGWAAAASLLLTTAASASPAGAPGAARGGPAAAAVPSIIGYQGQLTDTAGNPLSGSHNLTFQLWDDATAGTQIGADMVHPGVPVERGLFAVGLAVPPEAFDGTALWLRIAVDGTWLTPRQPLLGAPYAHTLRPGATISGNGPEPYRTLKVVNLGLGAALGAEGTALGLHARGMTGLKAEGDLGVFGLGMVGVRGLAPQLGTGVEGISEDGIGVSGEARNNGGKGVVGTANGYTSTGVEGLAQFGVGVVGSGETGVKATGTVGFGVQAEGAMGVKSVGRVGDGLFAETEGDEPAAAVRGAAATDAFGGHFTSAKGIGAWGIGLEGLHGEATDDKHAGVHGTGPGVGVLGEATDSIGVVGRSTHGAGVGASSTNGVGLSASAGTTPLVLYTKKVGVLAQGEDLGVSAWGGETGGVFTGSVGLSARGDGASGEGVHGHATGSLGEGVLGTSEQAAGVYGIAAGTGANAIGVWGQTAGTYGLYTAQKVYAGGGCVGCTVAQLAENAGTTDLAPGDVVAVIGLAAPLPGQTTPRLSVRRASAADAGLRGVAQGRVEVGRQAAQIGSNDGQTAEVAIPAIQPDAAGPGEGLVVVLSGLAQVRVSAADGAIRPGDSLAVGSGGAGIRLGRAEPAVPLPLGYALEGRPTGTGLVWALVLAR